MVHRNYGRIWSVVKFSPVLVLTPDFRLAIDQSIKVTKLSISGGEQVLHTGVPRALQAFGFFTDGSKINVTSQVQWQNSDDSMGVIGNEFSQKGRLSPVKEGELRVSVSGFGLKSDDVLVSVSSSKLKELSISASSIQLPSGTESILTVTGLFEGVRLMNNVTLEQFRVNSF